MSILGNILNKLDEKTPLDDGKKKQRPKRKDNVPLDVARAAIFVDMASIDSNFDRRERAFIIKTLMVDLKVSQQKAELLIQQAQSLLQLRGSGSFATELRTRLPEKDRLKIMEDLKTLMRADSVIDPFELYLLQKVATALDVPLNVIQPE